MRALVVEGGTTVYFALDQTTPSNARVAEALYMITTDTLITNGRVSAIHLHLPVHPSPWFSRRLQPAKQTTIGQHGWQPCRTMHQACLLNAKSDSP